MASDNCGFCGKPIVLTEQAKECKCGATNRELPALTCSEVVERLAGCYSVKFLPNDGLEVKIDRVQAEKILHSWRERRVQELEEALSRYEPDPDFSQKELVKWHHTRMHEVVNRAYRVYCDTKTVFPKGLARWMGVNTEDDFSKVISEREMRKKLEQDIADRDAIIRELKARS